MLSDRHVGNLKFLLSTLYNTTGLRSDGYVLVDLSLPNEVKVEFSAVLN
jgi:hypothetical protein